MKRLGCTFGLVLLFMTSLVVAQISLSEPDSVYNLGDRLYVSAYGLRGSDSGNLNIDLKCGNFTVNLVKLSARSFSPDEDQTYAIPYKILDRDDLEIDNLNQILGTCQVVASLSFGVASSETFTVSNNVVVSASVDKPSYNPGEAITLKVDALKSNGELLNGFVDVSNATTLNKVIEGGSVSDTFSLPETYESGTYFLGVHVYDTGSSGILNEGYTTVFFDINQIPTSLVIGLSDVEVVPGDNFTLGGEIFDQSGIKMEGLIDVVITSPDLEEMVLSIPSGDFNAIDFPLNSTIGIWTILSTFDDIINERTLEILPVQKVEFEFEDSVLVVKNVGNALYNKTISVEVGEEVMSLELNVEVGEERKFALEAPNGEYEVVVNDGESAFSRQVLLTGNAISVSDFKDVGIFKSYSILWIFLIIILGSAGFVFFTRYRKTKTITEKGKLSSGIGVVKSKFGFVKSKVKSKVPEKVKAHVSDTMNFTNKSPVVQGLDSKNYSHKDKSMVDLTNKQIGSAESTLVLKGEKYGSSVVSLRIKNYNDLNDLAKSSLLKIVNGVRDTKGLVDWRDDYIFIVFSPLMTRTYHNEILAVKAGFSILKGLNDYNKKYNNKIEFNIGAHAGELIASKAGGKFKYTSVGNTISFSKRISDSSSGKLLVSDEIRRKIIRDLKVDKEKDIGDKPVYSVSEIKDKAANAAKLKDLLKRQG